MPNYKNTVSSRKGDFTRTSYEQDGRYVTETRVTQTIREQVPNTNNSRAITSSSGSGSKGGRPQFETYTRTETQHFRTEVPIQEARAGYSGDYYGGGSSSGDDYSYGGGSYGGGNELVSYHQGGSGQGGGYEIGEGYRETVHGSFNERWTTGPNGGGRRSSGGGRRK